MERDGFTCYSFIKSEEKKKGADVYSYSKKIRRTRSLATLQDGDKAFGSETTFYEVHLYLPWDATFRILGEDRLGENRCLVVEARSALCPDFYLSKWVSWIETANFRDLHVEYFNQDGKLCRIADKIWTQVESSGHWVYDTSYYHNLQTKARSFVKFHNWIIDAGLEEGVFDPVKMTEEKIWRKPKNPPPVIEDISELPPLPEIRKNFWEKINTKVDVVE